MDRDKLEQVGERLRALREQRGWSLSALAKAADVGKGSLSELESGQRNPTLATLYALAEPLQVPLSALLHDRTGAMVSSDGLSATLLDSRADEDASVEVYRLDFETGADRHSPAHGPGVREHVYITSGQLLITHAAGVDELRAGDSLTFDSASQHRYQAARPTAAILIITSPAATPHLDRTTQDDTTATTPR